MASTELGAAPAPCAAAASSYVEHYEACALQAKAEYGENTFLLYQNGSFFEVQNEDAVRMAAILNYRTATARGRTLAGVPLCNLERDVQKLLQHGCRVVVYEQRGREATTASRKRPGFAREQTRVYTPGIPACSDATGFEEAEGVACAFLEFAPGGEAGVIGFATAAPGTGRTSVSSARFRDREEAREHLRAFLSAARPAELLVASDAEEELARTAVPPEAWGAILVDVRAGAHSKDQAKGRMPSTRMAHARATLRAAFGADRGPMLDELDLAGLRDAPAAALNSFVELVAFLHRCFPQCIGALRPPEVDAIPEEGEGAQGQGQGQAGLGCRRMRIANNGLYQLGVLNARPAAGQAGQAGQAGGRVSRAGNPSCLMDVLSPCMTAAGRREMLRRVCAPETCGQEIDRRLDLVQALTEERPAGAGVALRTDPSRTETFASAVRARLRGTRDPERLLGLLRSGRQCGGLRAAAAAAAAAAGSRWRPANWGDLRDAAAAFVDARGMLQEALGLDGTGDTDGTGGIGAAAVRDDIEGMVDCEKAGSAGGVGVATGESVGISAADDRPADRPSRQPFARFLRPGVDHAVDALEGERLRLEASFDALLKALNACSGSVEGTDFREECREGGALSCVVTTPARWKKAVREVRRRDFEVAVPSAQGQGQGRPGSEGSEGSEPRDSQESDDEGSDDEGFDYPDSDGDAEGGRAQRPGGVRLRGRPANPFAAFRHRDKAQAGEEEAREEALAAEGGPAQAATVPGGALRYGVASQAPKVGTAAARLAQARLAQDRLAQARSGGGGDSAATVFGGNCVRHPALDALCLGLAAARVALREAQRAANARLAAEFLERRAAELELLCGELADLDVAAAAASTALRWGHVRPTVVSSLSPDRPPAGARGAVAEGGSVSAAGLRHPVVEGALDSRESYVGNDAVLDERRRGVLLYGVNCAGKSCYMKSVGLAVVMAQAGLFVAADRLEIAPFRSLHTRIWRGDDLSRGVSLFQNEMLELRQILRASGPGALVLGDELCSGTEEASAVALVAAGVRELAARGARFLFATHLHRLPSLPCIQVLLGSSPSRAPLRVCHLAVDYCEERRCLVYARELREGPGPDRYGIEVAKALDMGRGFIRAAIQAYREVTGEDAEQPVTFKPTRYSRRVIASATCDRCGSNDAQDTHHLVPRAKAEPRAKNRAHNLARLCAGCHDAVHEGLPPGEAAPLRWVRTSAGLVLASACGT